MAEHTITEDINLHDVWKLLTDTASKLDQIYTALQIDKTAPSEQISAPIISKRVMDHPFFGMMSEEEDVSDVMSRLRENRYAL